MSHDRDSRNKKRKTPDLPGFCDGVQFLAPTLVEDRGLEPLTSTMPLSRSPN